MKKKVDEEETIIQHEESNEEETNSQPEESNEEKTSYSTRGK